MPRHNRKTGNYDINGKEIIQGDKIKKNGIITTAVWSEEDLCFCHEIENPEYGILPWVPFDDKISEWEIIGVCNDS